MIAAAQLLPPGGLDQSILLAVLVGVLVALACTETLGWVFVGLVVPGYLASVLVVQPTTAGVIVLEAVLTYLLARGLAYALAPTGAWTPFFGRDRFFLIVILSVLVRQHDQLWLLPALSTWLEGQLGTALPPVREFYSIGLVLVPLTANMLWKPGLRRGLVQLAVVVGLTWAALAYLLLPYTNLSLASFELLYEDTAIDFLGNAKAYILLLTSAALAARFNLRFGWDFGGILVPALLGLLWFSPRDLAITLAEALALWACALVVLKKTPLARLNLEGPRKVALVLTLGIGLKWLLSLGVGGRIPGLRARELFGFGYLLSTLLALRMLHRGSARRVLLPTLTTAALGAGLGSVVGFGLELAAPTVPARPLGGPEVASLRLLRSELGALALARVHAELAPPPGEPPPPAAARARAEAFTALGAWLRAPTSATRSAAAGAAALAGLALYPLTDPTGPGEPGASALLPSEQGGDAGLPLALLYPGAPGPVLAVPRPVAEAPAAEAALALCRALRCRAVLVAGRDQEPGAHDPFQAALDALAPEGPLALRADPDLPLDRPQLRAPAEPPRDPLDLAALARFVGPPEPVLAPVHELRVHPRALLRVLLRDAPAPRRAPDLLPWLAERLAPPRPLPRTTGVPPSRAELVFLERRLAAPLRGDDPEQHALAARLAALVDYEVWHVERDTPVPGDTYRALAESWRPDAAGWGVLVLDPGAPGPAFEVPRAAAEPGVWRLAAELFATTRGRALLLAPDADLRSPFTALQAFHQAVAGPVPGDSRGGAALELRGLAPRLDLRPDTLVVGLGRPALRERPLPPALAALLAPDGPLGGPAWILADGSPDLAPLAAAGDPRLEFSRDFAGDDAAVLWLPPALRRAHAVPDPCPELARLAALGLVAPAPRDEGCARWSRDERAALRGDWPEDPVLRATSPAALERPAPPVPRATSRPADDRPDPADAPLAFPAALALVERYPETGNLHLLRRVLAAPDLRLTAGLGRTSGRAFLALCERVPGARCALVRLGPADPGRIDLDRDDLARAPWLPARTLLTREAAP